MTTRICIIEIATGIVVGVGIKGEDLPPNAHQPTEPPEGFLWVENQAAGVGWTYVNGVFTPPAPVVVVPPTADELEADCAAFLNGGAQRIDLRKVIKAKAISDEAYRLGVNPGALTAQQLQNLRARIAAIYKAL